MPQNDPDRGALGDREVGNTPQLTERLVNPAGVAQLGMNEAGATLGAELSKQGILQIASVAAPVLLKAALKPFNEELSVAGRALTKHPQVPGFADNTALQPELRTMAAI